METGALRTLLLLRHAKSSRPDGVADLNRPLSPRGRRDARAAGRRLSSWGLTCDLVLSSPATRTRETWEQAALGGATATEVSYPSEIYQASLQELVELVGRTAEPVRTLLVVGHGPGLPDLAQRLAAGGSGTSTATRGWAELTQGFPTCGLARFAVSGTWAELRPEQVELVEFTVPRGR